MLRDRNLIPLSHHHQHALALCVRVERSLKAGEKKAADWLDEVTRAFESEIRYHFDAEEKVLFPVAEKVDALHNLVKHLRSEHGTLRGFFERARAGKLDEAGLQTFVETLRQHVHTEERELFEGMQAHLSAEQMNALGEAMDRYFLDSGMPGASCSVRPKAR